MKIRVDVRNEGARAAEETVFLFTHDKVASVARPLLELKGFAKIDLRPGEAGTVTLSLRAADLRFLGLDLEARVRARRGRDFGGALRGSLAAAGRNRRFILVASLLRPRRTPSEI